jgi:hypothetical protein
MKSPPRQVPDDDAYEATEKFIRDNARRTAKVQEDVAAS